MHLLKRMSQQIHAKRLSMKLKTKTQHLPLYYPSSAPTTVMCAKSLQHLTKLNFERIQMLTGLHPFKSREKTTRPTSWQIQYTQRSALDIEETTPCSLLEYIYTNLLFVEALQHLNNLDL
jgi:hypothetical protein